MKLGDLELLEKVLDLCYLRHEIISSNISNAETPGYVPKDIDFETALKNATSPVEAVTLKVTDPRHISPGSEAVIRPAVVSVYSPYPSLDGNRISIEEEMARLSKNTLEYQALIKIVSKKFSELRFVINEGRR